MVSGFVTSPDDQSWICLVEARPILIASNSLMSINASHPFWGGGGTGGDGRGWRRDGSSPSLLHLDLVVLDVARARIRGQAWRVVLVGLREHLVGRQRELAVGVEAVDALLDLLGAGLARGGAQGPGREVDAELLRGAQQLVVLLPDLDLAAALGEDVDVEPEGLHLLQQHLEGLGDRGLG